MGGSLSKLTEFFLKLYMSVVTLRQSKNFSLKVWVEYKLTLVAPSQRTGN